MLERSGGAPGACVVAAPLSNGFILPDSKVAVLSESDITGRRLPHRRARPRARATDGFFDDLAVGSFVVHRQHGVARFEGVTSRTMGGTTRDYLILSYRGSDRLYLPVDQIEAITAYSGGETPTLSKMGGADWQRTRAKARAAAGEVAEELVQLYRRRLAVEGHAFGPDTPWQAEMEASFEFVETEDQLRAIADVKADMEEPRPMDRLICGDVGFGKTEVSRARRLQGGPGREAGGCPGPDDAAGQPARPDLRRSVRALSRSGSSCSAASCRRRQQKKVIEGLADGSVDVVIGTHRLLGQDVVFKRLGLLVVDEEQRFGVTHKEAVKRLAEGVDVLTLTASPIPRTLEMALTGIRDLSMVNTPPADRRPILTYVGEHDPAAVSEALRRELLREGQAFYVHNRVADIDSVARQVRSLVPEARVAIAHGQMDEGSLESVVLDFWERRYDVLVCTTIIESGIDMPSVNTLIVDRADLLGLGQLHQIRGRVGSRRAARLRLPLPPRRPGPQRAGLRTAADDRRAHRARIGVQDRHARPRDPRRRQPLGRRPVRPHRRRRLRPLRTAGGRSGGRGPGRRPARAPPTVALDVPGRRPPPQGLRRPPRMPVWRPTVDWRRCRPTPMSRTSVPNGPTATGRSPAPPSGCSPSPACARRRWLGGSARSR